MIWIIAAVLCFNFCAFARAEPGSTHSEQMSKKNSDGVQRAPSWDRQVPEGYVIMESYIEATAEELDKYGLVPYLKRRPDWTYEFFVGAGPFEPRQFESSFAAAFFEDIYAKSLPTMEAGLGFKRNFRALSIMLNISYGYLNLKAKEDSSVPSELTLNPVKIGILAVFDSWFLEPYIVAFFGGGVYSVIFEETLQSASHSGTTQAAFYYNLGLMFQLDWMDRVAAFRAFQENGIENTFLAVEARQFFSSASESDPDFGTALTWNGSIRVEF